MKILMISPFLPYPLSSGGHTRIYNLIKYLGKNHDIDFISLIFQNEAEYIKEIEKYCNDVYCINIDIILSKKKKFIGRNSIGRLLSRIWMLIKGIPWESSGFYFKEMKDKIDTLIKNKAYDIVQVEFPRMALHLNKSFFNNPRFIKILTDLDLSFVTMERRYKKEKSLFLKILYFIDYTINKSFAIKTWKKFNHLIVMSEVDKMKAEKFLQQTSIHSVPNGVDLKTFKPLKKKNREKRIMLLGGTGHFANIDAYTYFIDEIYPIVKKKIKDISLYVIGSGWEKFQQQTKDSSIIFTGFVNDISMHVSNSTVLAAPIRIGGGTRLKILEAMGLGIPVISTSIGCEGIKAIDGKHVLIFNGSEEFAEKINMLFNSRKLYDNLVKNANLLVNENYGWNTIAKTMENIYITFNKK